jgi:hypothetical protein
MVGAPDPPHRHEVKNERGKKPETKREGASVVSGSAAFRRAGRQGDSVVESGIDKWTREGVMGYNRKKDRCSLCKPMKELLRCQ